MQQLSKTQITHDRAKGWNACPDGYRWFVKNYPQPEGAEFSMLYKSLIADGRRDDANWLTDKLFVELIGSERNAEIAKLARGEIESETTGDYAHAATTGDRAHAATTGYYAHAATTGKSAVSVALGYRSKACAEAGAIMLTEHDGYGLLIGVAASMVGQNGVDPGVWYELIGGVITRCAEQPEASEGFSS